MSLHDLLKTRQNSAASVHREPVAAANSQRLAVVNAVALEWPELIAKLANEASLPSTKESLKKLEPDLDAKEREFIFDLTSEMTRILEAQWGFFQFAPIEPEGALESVRLQRVLQSQELLEIRKLLELGLQAKAFDSGREASGRRAEHPLCCELLQGLNPNAKLYQKLARSIGDEAEVLSTGSDELRKAREAISVAERKLITELERLLKSGDVKEALQEVVWMRRDGRYVLPVRTDRKSAVDGVTIGVSQSGSTLFIEPAQLAQVRSALDAARRDEQIAISRLIAELSQDCAAHYEALHACFSILQAIDELVARGRFVKKLGATRPRLHNDFSLPRFDLKSAKHPLFVLEDKPCVANDFATRTLESGVVPHLQSPQHGKQRNNEHPKVVVLSGPNAGGKTVTMKTVGLLVLMAKAGLFVPALEAEFFEFDKIFAAIGDNQNRSEDLSTFSAHLANLLHVLKAATSSSLVLLDEGFVGTDPAMGASLARAVLEHLAAKGTCSIITTHFSQLKTIADDNPRFMNASMEFEPTKLSPTYRLLAGVPGQSYAFELAERMGYESELLAQARKHYGQEAGRLEALLKELQIKRNKAEEEKKAAENLRAEAEALKNSMEGEYNNLRNMKSELAAQYESQLTKRLNAFRNSLEIKERQFEKQKQRMLLEIEEMQRLKNLKNNTGETGSGDAVHSSAPTNSNNAIVFKGSKDASKGIALKDFSELASLAKVIPKKKQHQETLQASAKRSNRQKETESVETLPLGLSAHELLESAQESEAQIRVEFESLRQSFAEEVDAWFEHSGTSKRMRQFSEARQAIDAKAGEQFQRHSAADFTLGSRVLSKKFKGKGEVTEKANAKGFVSCQFSSIKAKIHYTELELVRESVQTTPTSRSMSSPVKAPSGSAKLDMLLPPQTVFPSRTVDLRGCEADVAIDKLELFLDRVFREDMSSFVILHGHGSGVVKAAVRNWLKSFQAPCRYRPGTQGEGGDGVTVVVFES